MRANSPSSLLLSFTLHALFVAAILVATYFFTRQVRQPPVIFELVAGDATAPDELVAPALGNTTNKITLDIPKVELVPTMPEPEPVVQTKPEPVPVKPPPVKAVTKAPDKPKAVPTPPKETRMSYQEFLKKHPTPKQATPAKTRPATPVPKIDATGIAAGVQGGSTANTKGGGGGKALSREQQDAMNTYISLLIQELKKAHEPPPGVSDRLEARVTFDITASGAIMNPRITKSSGDKAFDQSVLEAFLRVRSIGPTPNRRPDTWTVTFRMRDDA